MNSGSKRASDVAAAEIATSALEAPVSGSRQGHGFSPLHGGKTDVRNRGTGSKHYSRFVQGLRLLLPVVTVVLVLLVALWPEFNAIEDTIAVSGSPISLEDAERLTMSNPRYMSEDESGMAYVVTADLAEQMDAENTRMTLMRPAADVTLEDGSWVMLEAQAGEYWDEEKRLFLEGDVSLFHDAGYEFHTEEATVDFAAGRAEGDRDVQGFGAFGDIRSEGFAIEDHGAVIIFTGQAHMVLRIDEELPAQ